MRLQSEQSPLFASFKLVWDYPLNLSLNQLCVFIECPSPIPCHRMVIIYIELQVEREIPLTLNKSSLSP